MAAEEQSAFRRAARQKWPQPHISITGHGEWALVCPTTNSVRLYDFAMLAKVHAAQDCSNWQCKAGHKLVRIKPAPVQRQRVFRNPADMERD